MLTTETIENIPVLYATGQHSIREIALKSGCSETTVKKYLKLAKLNPCGDRSFSRIEAQQRGDEMAALYATGQYTLKAIADKYGVSKQRVHQAVQNATQPKSRKKDQRHEASRVRRQNAAADYLGGMAIEEVAEKYGYSVSGVRRVFWELGLSTKTKSKYPGENNGFGDEEYAEVERLRDSGWTQNELATHMGCSRDIIRGMLARIKAMRREQE